MYPAVPVQTSYKIHTISRVYARINEFLLPVGCRVISDFELEFGNVDDYRLIGLIGSGKYSFVFLGKCRNGFCAIKVLKNIAPSKIKRELFILKRVSGVPGVVQVLNVNKDETDCVSIVTEFVRTDPPRTLYPSLSLDEIRYYGYLLVSALDACHQRGVMHRDVKPGNVCIDHRNKVLKIIDWGLSDLYYPWMQYSVRVSTLRYKAPELLLGYRFYDYGIDVWGVGCVLAEMLFGFEFIKGETPEDVLGSIAGLWGEKAIVHYCEKYGLDLTPGYECKVKGKVDGWSSVVMGMRSTMRDNSGVDLIKKMLTVDHDERITLREALQHPFFRPLFQ